MEICCARRFRCEVTCNLGRSHMEPAALSRSCERRGVCFEDADCGTAGTFRLDVMSFRRHGAGFDNAACFDNGITGNVQCSIGHVTACGDGSFTRGYIIQFRVALNVYIVATLHIGRIDCEAAAFSRGSERCAACYEAADGSFAGAFCAYMAVFRRYSGALQPSSCRNCHIPSCSEAVIADITSCYDGGLSCSDRMEVCRACNVCREFTCHTGRSHIETAACSRGGEGCAACVEGTDGGTLGAGKGGLAAGGDGGHIEGACCGDSHIAIRLEMDFFAFFPSGLGSFRISEGEGPAFGGNTCCGDGPLVFHIHRGACVGAACNGTGIGQICKRLASEVSACQSTCVLDRESVALAGTVGGEDAAGDAAGGLACFIFGHFAFIGDGSGLADEGAAGDGAFRCLGGGMFCRVVHGERAGRLEIAACDGAAAGHVEGGTCVYLSAASDVAEESDVAVTGNVSGECAGLRRFPCFRSGRAGNFDAEGVVLSFSVFSPIGTEILHLTSILGGNLDILALDIDEGGTLDLVPRLIVSVIAAFAVDAGAVCYREFHIPFGSVDRMDHEVAFILGKGDSFLRPGGEDAVTFGDGDIRNLSFPGFENDLVIGTNRDTCDVAACFEAELVIGEELASCVVAVFGDQVEAAFFSAGGNLARSVCRDGRHRADGNHVAVDFEVAPFCRREREELCGRKVFQISCGEINLHAFRLLSDAAGTLVSIGIAFGYEGDIHAGYVRHLLDGGVRIGDAFLDAAGAEGDEEILRGFRRAYEDRRFLILREELVTDKVALRKRRTAVGCMLTILDFRGIGFYILLRPGIYAGCFETIVFRLALHNVSIRIDALRSEDLLFSFRKRIWTVFHIHFETVIFLLTLCDVSVHVDALRREILLFSVRECIRTVFYIHFERVIFLLTFSNVSIHVDALRC